MHDSKRLGSINQSLLILLISLVSGLVVMTGITYHSVLEVSQGPVATGSLNVTTYLERQMTCIEKEWKSDCGIVTVKTTQNPGESNADFVARHKAKVAEMEKLCPPTE